MFAVNKIKEKFDELARKMVEGSLTEEEITLLANEFHKDYLLRDEILSKFGSVNVDEDFDFETVYDPSEEVDLWKNRYERLKKDFNDKFTNGGELVEEEEKTVTIDDVLRKDED